MRSTCGFDAAKAIVLKQCADAIQKYGSRLARRELRHWQKKRAQDLQRARPP